MTDIVRKGEQEYRKLTLAAEAGKRGDYALALKILQELISNTFVPAEAWLLLGRTFHSLGDYSRAIAAYNDYIKQRPRSSQAYFFVGRTYLAAAMPHKAVPFLKKAHDLQPANVQIMALLAMAYLKSKHSKEAVDMLRSAVEFAAKTGMADTEYRRIYRAYLNALLVRGVRLCRINEYDLGGQMLSFVLENSEYGMDGPFLRLELGRAYRETGRFEEALEHYSRALEFAPNDRRIRWSRVSVLMALGKIGEAGKDIALIRSKEPGIPELPWNSRLVDIFMIRSFLETKEWHSAAELCRNCLRREDNHLQDAAVHGLCAESLRNLRDYKAAHNHLVRAQEQEPGEIQFWYADLLVSWEGKNWSALRKALRMVKKLGGEPDIIKRFSVLLGAHYSRDDKKTLALLQKAVRNLGPETELMNALAKAYLKLGFAREAGSWFKKTIQFKDLHEEAWLGAIAAQELLAAEGETEAVDELGRLYNSYLKRWPDNFRIRRERALFLIKIFEFKEAVPELEKLLLKEPSNQSLRRVLAYAYRKTGRYQEAAVFLKALLRERPGNLELLLEYSGCLERSGGARYALAILQKAREIFADSAHLYLALGILNFRLNKIEESFDSLRVAATLDKNDPRPYEWMAVISRKNGDAGNGNYYEREAQNRRNSKD
jgi:tetratricopeptide (TPR) repeat protein